MKRLSDLPNVQRMWIDEFERITSHTTYGENWKRFMMNEISWDDFMNTELDNYATRTQENLFILANLYHYLEKQIDETDRV